MENYEKPIARPVGSDASGTTPNALIIVVAGYFLIAIAAIVVGVASSAVSVNSVYNVAVSWG